MSNVGRENILNEKIIYKYNTVFVGVSQKIQEFDRNSEILQKFYAKSMREFAKKSDQS